ncbi:MAG: hypothetical protein OWT28_03390 [Firmicutes bacterium]|nr:hypothetical protein [Bacillota bacterium]
MKERSAARPLSWIFYTLVLPIIFTMIIIALIVQFILGINIAGAVSNWALSNPAVRHTMGLGPVPVPVPRQVATLDAVIQRDVQMLATLRRQNANLQSDITSLQTRVAQATQKLQEAQRQIKGLKTSNHSAQNAATVYMDMAPNQAALIIERLPFEQQVMTLKAMDASDQASILSEFSTAQAAKLLQAGA